MKINYWHDFKEGSYYHVYNHAVSDQNIFTCDKDYTDFLTKHYKYLSVAFDTIAFCLMPNHFHFVLKVKSIVEIQENAKREISNASSAFQKGEIDVDKFILDQYRRFFSSHSLSYNHHHKRRGQLFLKRFKRVELDPDSRLQYMIVYLHHNPIHHRFVKDFHLWKYSSYHKFTSKELDPNYSRMINQYFGSLPKFHRFHEKFKNDYKNP